MGKDERNMLGHEHTCGHEGEHGHEHTCGHEGEHGHEHTCSHEEGHEHHHTCGHEEAHEHHAHHHDETCECPSCTMKKEKLKVTSLLQDSAVVVSAEYHTAADRDRAGELLTARMETLAGRIDAQGGIIGHIKTSVELRYVEMYSLTDKTVMKKASDLPELTFYMAAIVFAVKEKELLCLVREMFEDMDRQLHEDQ